MHGGADELDAATLLDIDLSGTKLIEASAGTGKTYTIANLYLRHVIAGREVGKLLVVTFTVAATEELRGRIRARLFETLSRPRPGVCENVVFYLAIRPEDFMPVVNRLDEAGLNSGHGRHRIVVRDPRIDDNERSVSLAVMGRSRADDLV